MVGIVDRANTSVEDLGGGSWKITKIGGTDGAFDASAISASAIAGDFVLWARSLTPSLSAFVAMSVNPFESDGFTTLDYGAQIDHAALAIFERGVFRPPVVAHGGGVWIERSGATLRYRTGPTFAGSSIQRSVPAVVGPLSFDSSIETIGGAIEVRFDRPGGWAGTRRRSVRATLALGFGVGGAGR